MATTTNYSWTTPDDTALVKDGAAAIRSLGTAIDTTVFTNAGAAVAKATVDAKGDLIAGTADNTIARLGVGANDTVLTADSSTATGLKWAAPAAGGASYSLLNAGGTSLTGSSVTVSGISGKETIYVILSEVQMDTNEATMRMRINGDTGSNYEFYGSSYTVKTSYAASIFGSTGSGGAGEAQINLGKSSSAGTSIYRGGFTIQGANSTGIKTVDTAGGFTNGTGENNTTVDFRGIYTGSSAVSSVTIFANTGNFSAGTVYVYTTA